ncbi:uncharacterized protein VTP21DRAFT_5882 [Calcarisporiella thermophila]|uniref:uncharacterized protein n=1 Tax=Calcarisporiella thermophila TaxID=911321 RepID=UPI003744A2EB
MRALHACTNLAGFTNGNSNVHGNPTPNCSVKRKNKLLVSLAALVERLDSIPLQAMTSSSLIVLLPVTASRLEWPSDVSGSPSRALAHANDVCSIPAQCSHPAHLQPTAPALALGALLVVMSTLSCNLAACIVYPPPMHNATHHICTASPAADRPQLPILLSWLER